MLKQILKYSFVLLLYGSIDAYCQVTPVLSTQQKVKPKEVADSIIVQNKREASKTISDIKENVSVKNHLFDSVPKVDKAKLIKVPKVDSVGVSYENGKLNLPDQLPQNVDEEALRKKAREKLSGLPKNSIREPRVVGPDKLSIPDKDMLKDKDWKSLPDQVPAPKVKEYGRKIQDISDSVMQLVKKGEELVDGKSLHTARKVYSEKALKRLYDSLGVSKLDSVLSLVPIKKEVSKEELLQAINFTMPSSPMTQEPTSIKDLPIGDELTSLKEDVPMPGLAGMKLPQDVLGELPPIRGFQFPSDKFRLLDSLRKINLTRNDLALKEEEVKEGLESVVAKKKPKFWDKTYFEAVASYLKFKESNLIQFAPSLGFRVKGNFSVGLGPNILVKEENKNWNVSLGYRTFGKYEFLSQRAYIQVEDMVDPSGLSSEYLKNLNHSILAGGGFLIPISRLLSINFSVLYRINNEQYSGNQISPWVFRLGLSSVKSVKKQ